MEAQQRNTQLEGTFRPLLSSRRGELYAWGITAVLALAALATYVIVGGIPWPYWILLGFFLFAAILTTFGNWVDRNTMLTISPTGVEFYNKLRSVSLPWDVVEEMVVHADRWGKRVQVRGKDGQHFTFRTIIKVEIHAGREEAVFGFREGEDLIATIAHKAGLTRQEEDAGEVRYTRG